MTLTNKQSAFIEHYLVCWDGAKAARRAGYSERSIYSIASENLKKPKIRAAIQARLKELKMDADEVVSRLSQMARADIGDFLHISTQDSLSLKVAALQEKGHLVKSMKDTKDGIHFTLHDSMRALELLGKHQKVFEEQEQEERPININVNIPLPEGARIADGPVDQ